MRALPRRLLWVLLIGVALALILVIARHDQEPFGRLATDDLGDLAYHLALVVFVGGAVLMMFRERPSAALEAALFWVVVGFVLVFVGVMLLGSLIGFVLGPGIGSASLK